MNGFVDLSDYFNADYFGPRVTEAEKILTNISYEKWSGW